MITYLRPYCTVIISKKNVCVIYKKHYKMFMNWTKKYYYNYNVFKMRTRNKFGDLQTNVKFIHVKKKTSSNDIF